MTTPILPDALRDTGTVRLGGLERPAAVKAPTAPPTPAALRDAGTVRLGGLEAPAALR